MKAVFLQILDMSVSASILAGAVMVLRLLLKKAPKYIHCILWAMVALRLVCPSLPESQVSVMPDSHPVSSVVQPQQQAPVTNVQPPVQAPQVSIPDHTVTVMPEPERSVDWMSILGVIWLSGVGAMALYGFGSYIFLRRKVSPAVKEDGIWLCDSVASPFILGIFRPRIYLPSVLQPEYRASVLAHEKAHLRRKDHWWKPLGFALLAVHWFNPVMWIAYILLCRDIEAACDERVVKGMEPGDRKVYSEALLSCAAPRRSIAACPLAFGEQGVKGRIKSVLSYKKPAVWIVLVTVIASVAVAVFFLTDPMKEEPENNTENTNDISDLIIKAPSYFQLDTFKGIEVYVWEEDGELACGAMSGTNRNKTDAEIRSLKGIKLEEMAVILDTYAIPDWYIVVHPFGQSQHWTEEQTKDAHAWVKIGQELRPRLGLYVIGENEGIGSDFRVATKGDIQPVFGDGFFYAKSYDGLYRVYCSDVGGLSEGDRLSISYVNKKDIAGTVKHEITAKKIFNFNAKPTGTLIMDMIIAFSEPGYRAIDLDCFYATDSDGNFYRVYCNEMTGLSEGKLVRVIYSSDSLRELEYPNGYPDGGYTPKYEVTAIKAEPLPAQNEYVSMVYFIQEDAGHYWGAPNLEGAKYYAIPVTAEERDTLLKLEEGRVWQDTRLSSSLPASHMTMNVVVDGSWSFVSLNDDRYIVKERYYAVLTQEERDFIKALKSRAFETTDAQNYFTDDYLVYQQKTKQSS